MKQSTERNYHSAKASQKDQVTERKTKNKSPEKVSKTSRRTKKNGNEDFCVGGVSMFPTQLLASRLCLVWMLCVSMPPWVPARRAHSGSHSGVDEPKDLDEFESLKSYQFQKHTTCPEKEPSRKTKIAFRLVLPIFAGDVSCWNCTNLENLSLLFCLFGEWFHLS